MCALSYLRSSDVATRIYLHSAEHDFRPTQFGSVEKRWLSDSSFSRTASTKIPKPMDISFRKIGHAERRVYYSTSVTWQGLRRHGNSAQWGRTHSRRICRENSSSFSLRYKGKKYLSWRIVAFLIKIFFAVTGNNLYINVMNIYFSEVKVIYCLITFYITWCREFLFFKKRNTC